MQAQAKEKKITKEAHRRERTKKKGGSKVVVGPKDQDTVRMSPRATGNASCSLLLTGATMPEGPSNLASTIDLRASTACLPIIPFPVDMFTPCEGHECKEDAWEDDEDDEDEEENE